MKIKNCEHDSHLDKHSAERLEDAKKRLKESGGRLTEQRVKILRALISKKVPLTSDQIYEKVAGHGVDRVTVFRNLTALEEQGILRRQDFGDGVRRFELHVREHHHHYIVCRGCGFSQPIDLCGISSTMEKEIKKMGFNDVRHAMSFSALCKSCA